MLQIFKGSCLQRPRCSFKWTSHGRKSWGRLTGCLILSEQLLNQVEKKHTKRLSTAFITCKILIVCGTFNPSSSQHWWPGTFVVPLTLLISNVNWTLVIWLLSMYYHHYLSAQFMVLAHKHLLLLLCVALGNVASHSITDASISQFRLQNIHLHSVDPFC